MMQRGGSGAESAKNDKAIELLLLRQLFPQRPSQNLPHIRLRKIIPEVHVFRHLVAGERLSTVLDHFLLREIRILLHDEQGNDLT